MKRCPGCRRICSKSKSLCRWCEAKQSVGGGDDSPAEEESSDATSQRSSQRSRSSCGCRRCEAKGRRDRGRNDESSQSASGASSQESRCSACGCGRCQAKSRRKDGSRVAEEDALSEDKSTETALQRRTEWEVATSVSEPSVARSRCSSCRRYCTTGKSLCGKCDESSAGEQTRPSG